MKINFQPILLGKNVFQRTKLPFLSRSVQFFGLFSVWKTFFIRVRCEKFISRRNLAAKIICVERANTFFLLPQEHTTQRSPGMLLQRRAAHTLRWGAKLAALVMILSCTFAHAAPDHVNRCAAVLYLACPASACSHDTFISFAGRRSLKCSNMATVHIWWAR